MNKRRISVTGFLAALTITLFGGESVRADDAAEQQKAAIAKTAEAFVEAFKKEDANALAAFWTPDGDYTDIGGRVLKGHKAIAEDFADLFAENEGLTLRIEIHSVRFPTPDTAIEDGVTSVLSAKGLPPNRVRYTNFLVKKDGKWLLSSVRESAYTPPNNSEKLMPLGWAIGEWVEDAKQGHISRVTFEWSGDQNFIVATRAVVVADVLLDNGSQRIGWDPAAKVIRSWNFESDGGFGEGTWMKDGNKWVIRISSVLSSGSLMTATTVVTRVDADTITYQSKDQILDGKPLADSAVVTMKRVQDH